MGESPVLYVSGSHQTALSETQNQNTTTHSTPLHIKVNISIFAQKKQVLLYFYYVSLTGKFGDDIIYAANVVRCILWNTSIWIIKG